MCVFDVGTTGARTIFFDINGKEIAKAYEEYPLVKQPAGISEHDPIMWWNAIKNTCNNAIKRINPDNIIGISSSFFRSTTTIIDQNGNILHPALTWLDERELSSGRAMLEEGGLRRLIAKLLWLKNNKPELFNKAYKIITPDSYINFKLCNRHVTDPTNGIWGILNMKTLNWDEELSRQAEIPLNLWPEIHTPGDIIGELTSDAAEALGLKKNIPVVQGGADQQCAALGLGVIKKGQAKITTGTGTFVDYIVDEPIPPAGDFPIFSLPHVIKGKWMIEGAVPGTGSVLKWFKDNFSQMQIKECEEKNLNVYEVLTTEAQLITPGSEGVLFLPLQMFRKGTIHGLSWNHTRGHMIRAIMECAALSAQMYINILEGMARYKLGEIRVDGGGMNSSFWAQIFADITNKTILIPEEKDGAALGAAILGFYGCKRFSNFEKAIENMVRFFDTKVPQKENLKVYKKLSRIFMPALLEMYDKKRVTKDL